MKNVLIGATATALLLAAGGAQAQTTHHRAAASAAPAASAATQPPINHGPPIAGVCVYSNSRTLETSSVGRAFSNRLQQLRAQAAAEIGAEQTALQNDEKALAGKRATLTQDQFAQQAQPLQQREQALSQKAESRQRDLQYTYGQQLQRIAQSIEPIVRSAYEGHHCSLLLNGDGVMAANPAMDLTDGVVQQLNGTMSTITFDRETAPAQ